MISELLRAVVTEKESGMARGETRDASSEDRDSIIGSGIAAMEAIKPSPILGTNGD
jgi:hypothetical protein